MSYLSTLLLTATIFTTTHIHGADQLTEQAAPTASKAVSAVISSETATTINKLTDLVSRTEYFNVSNVITLLFSPELYPFISWRSAERNEDVVASVKKAMADSVLKFRWNRNIKLTGHMLNAVIFPDSLEKTPAPGYHESEGITNPTILNELVDGSMCWGLYENVLKQYELTFTPLLRLRLYLELLQQTNITPDSLGHILRTTVELTRMFMTDPNKHLGEHVDEFKQSVVGKVLPSPYQYTYSQLDYPSLQRVQTLTDKEE
jgi:hypothetical protein